MTGRDGQSKRYAGLELGGSKSARTALTVLEYFPSENKLFLRTLHTQIKGEGDAYSDERLLSLVREAKGAVLGVNAPLTLSPCLACKLPVCPGFRLCEEPAVRWMREESARLGIHPEKQPTPYTQRPVDLLVRGRYQDRSPVPLPSEESFGSGRAPLAARARYLMRHLDRVSLLEVQPRLALALLAPAYPLSPRELRRYRDVEDGVENRVSILEKLGDEPHAEGLPRIFLYNSDIYALARDLAAFDSFLCALMAVYSDLGLLEKSGFEPSWGELAVPKRLPAYKPKGGHFGPRAGR